MGADLSNPRFKRTNEYSRLSLYNDLFNNFINISIFI